MKVHRLLGGALSLLALSVTTASADSLFPNAGELWPHDYLHFFSTDMRPIQVTLRRDMFTNDGEQVTITLPRAWITFASGYDPLKLDRLPDVVETHSITVALTDPEGMPLSIRSREIAQAQHIALDEAIRRLRAEQYTVDIGYVPGRIRIEDWHLDETMRGDHITERDGLSYDTTWGSYLGQSGYDLFYSIRCQYDAKPDWYCDYLARPGENLRLRISFLDFRFHGGRRYANERLGRLLTAFCRQVETRCYSVDRHNPIHSP